MNKILVQHLQFYLLAALLLASLFIHVGVVNDCLWTAKMVSFWSLMEVLTTLLLSKLGLRSRPNALTVITLAATSLLVLLVAVDSFSSLKYFLDTPALQPRLSETEYQKAIQRIREQAKRQPE